MENFLALLLIIALVVCGLSYLDYAGDNLIYTENNGDLSRWAVGTGWNTKIYYKSDGYNCVGSENFDSIDVTCKSPNGVSFKGKTDRFEYTEKYINKPKYNIIYIFNRTYEK